MYKFLGIFLAGWLLFSCSSDEPEVVEELKKANAKDFSFSLLSVNTKEVSVEKIKSILKSPTGWTIKSLKIDDESFAEVTGTSVKDFKIKIKKAGEFSFSVTLQKTGYEDFILKGIKIKATFLADAKDFAFPLLELTGANEVTIEQIKKNLKSPTGWTIKSLKIDDESFAEVTGTSVKDFKIKIKKAGEFSFSVTLQKTGYEDFVLKGVKIKVNASTEPPKKADPSKFGFPLLPVNAKEVSFAVLRGNVRSPAGWTIKSLTIVDSDFGEVTGAGSNQKITIKKDGTFTINITLEKTGWVDFVLQGKIKASTPTQPLKKADAKDFDFPLLPVNVKEVSFAVLRGNLTSPAGWTIKSLTIVDSDFGEVTGAGSNQKITIKKDGTFAINITLGKTGYEDFVLKGKIKASTPTQPLKKADPSDFSFPELPVNAKEIPIATIQSNLKKPTGWTIKSIAVVDSDFGTVTGAGSSQKIVLKKGGTFVINITLQKTGWVDFVLKGVKIKATFKADAKDFSFPELPVNAKEIPFATIESNLTKPTGWTIKSIAVADSSFGDVTGAGSSQKIVLKKGGTFAINITLQKTGYEDFVLKGVKIKATFKADAKDFSFQPFLAVFTDNAITIEQLKKNLKSPAGWTIKSIKIDDSSYAEVMGTSVRDFKIKIKKPGTFTATIVLEKPNYIDATITNCEFDISKLTAPSLTFSKFETYNNDKNNSTITEAKILEKVQGKKAGYTLKSISQLSDANLAEVSGKTIKIKKEGTFTATIVLESDNYEDVTLTNCNFSYINVFNVVGTELRGYNDNKYKTQFTTLNIPNVIDGKTITSIGGNGAFESNGYLSSVTIPNSVTSIGYDAFRACTNLSSMVMSNSVTSIGSQAFRGCTNLSSIVMSNSVTSIGFNAFYTCTSLTKLTIPNSITNIGYGAFSKCIKLVIKIEQTNPANITLEKGDLNEYEQFNRINEIRVPAASLDTYKKANIWKNWAGKMKGY